MKLSVTLISKLTAAVLLTIVIGCSHHSSNTTQVFYTPIGAKCSEAICVLHATSESGVSGTIRFIQEDKDVRIIAKLSGLTPGKHGFHIHHLGDIRQGDGSGCAGHFNPENHNHGSPLSSDRHAGDLGNIVADSEGNAIYERVDRVLVLFGPYSIVGRSVIVHAGEDDLISQPTGAAGARVAQGVIGIAKLQAHKKE